MALVDNSVALLARLGGGLGAGHSGGKDGRLVALVDRVDRRVWRLVRARSRLGVDLLLLDVFDLLAEVRLDPLRWTLLRPLEIDLVITWAHFVGRDARVHQLGVLLPDQFAPSVFLVTEHIVVRRNGRRIGQQGRHAAALAPTAIWLATTRPPLLLMVGAGAWVLRLGAHVAALETLHARGEARVRLHEVDSELVEPEPLQSLRAFHVSVDFLETVRVVIRART